MITQRLLLRAHCSSRVRPITPAAFASCSELSTQTFDLRRTYHELSFEKMGEPIEVLEYKSDPSIKNGKPLSHITNSSLCRVEMLHVPWNPADVNMVQGRYASPYDSADGNPLSNQSPYFHHHRVAGSEGWGRVTEVVGNDNRIQKGSLVTVGLPSMGTLRSSLWVPSHALLRVPGSVYETLGPSGCSLFQLGGTAMRMLSDFVSSLKPGDTVIQNAGNSGVGVMASQLAAASNIQMVSVVRKGTKPPEEFDALVDYLRQEGKCARVAAEEDLVDKAAVKAFEQQLKDLSETNQLPKLALNAVGGPSAQLLLKVLEKGGAMVTYGGMSGEGIQVATPQLIFKDLQIKGYWHSRWMVNHSIEEKQDMIDSLAKSVLDGNVTCPPAKVFPLKDVKEALHWQSEQSNSVIRSKLVFDCQEA